MRTSDCCSDYCACAGGQIPSSQVGTVQQYWAVLYMHCCFKLSMTLVLESQAIKGLLYAQKGLVVARAAKLQGSKHYASLLDTIVNIWANRKVTPCDLGFRHGEFAIPCEGFTAAVADGQSKQRPVLAQTATFVQDHTYWVEELQAELVRWEGLAYFQCIAASLYHL